MDLKEVRNKPSRNAFPYEQSIQFTAKVGELLPIESYIVSPGQTIHARPQTFTRTININTAAFVRIREYYDYFFVPLRLLWKNFSPLVTKMQDNPNLATSITENKVVGENVPYLTTHGVKNYMECFYHRRDGETNFGYYDSGSVNPESFTNTPANRRYNYFGYNRGNLTRKLLQYLRYGSTNAYSESTKSGSKSYQMSPWRLLAYQKIYQDFFRDSQWEKGQTFTWNIDYLNANDVIPIADLITSDKDADGQPYPENISNMFDMRYCNWNKDYFMGVKPRAQYGDEAGVSLYIDASNFTEIRGRMASTLQSANWIGSDVVSKKDSGGFDVSLLTNGSSENKLFPRFLKSDVQTQLENLQASFSILALRHAQALQKWKEIVQCHDQDYRDQIKAIFGVNVPETLSNMSYWLNGMVSNISINEVVNTNITGDNGADIAGKGVGSQECKVNFTAKEHGVFMCIYHAVPLPSYDLDNIDAMNLAVNVHDYPNPVFDKIGMEQLDLTDMIVKDDLSSKVQATTNPIGYAPRYLPYKSRYDIVLGGFSKALGNMNARAWVAPIDEEYITSQLLLDAGQLYKGFMPVTYNFFKVNPNILDNIFPSETDGSCDSDRFHVNYYSDTKIVTNLDYNGLPY